MHRRNFLHIGAGAALCGGMAALGRSGGLLASVAPIASEESLVPPAFSVIPVVGDGNWIWNEPPKKLTGYLEPRPFQLEIGIHLEGRGNATNIRASTPAPISLPEQTLDEEKVEADGCDAQVRDISPLARQLSLSADGISAGQTIRATARYRLTLYKQYQAFERDQFPDDPKAQKISNEVRDSFLGDSPGIQRASRRSASCWKNCGATRGIPGPGPNFRRLDSQEYQAADRPVHQRRRRARSSAGRLRGNVERVRGPLPGGGHSGPDRVGAEPQLVGVLSARQGWQGALDTGPHGLLFLVRLDGSA